MRIAFYNDKQRDWEIDWTQEAPSPCSTSRPCPQNPAPRPSPLQLQPPPRGYDIRPARTPRQLAQALELVRRMYAWRGYSVTATLPAFDDPNRLTLVAWQAGEVAATLTIGRDSPDGLLADALYRDELGALRARGRVVCEVTRLAVNPDLRSANLLGDLFKAALRFGQERFTASDVIVEINPRHLNYYRRRYGFRQIGAIKPCPRVDAPAVLLHQATDGMHLAPRSPRR